ncbi:MAG: hypothetical protein WC450_09910 [Candidatus Omnitrophota bacterium]|jgi:hypothetical protein
MIKGKKMCLECKTEFGANRNHQKFCSDKCRHCFHNREKLGGLPLIPSLRDCLRSLANAHDVSEKEMACRVLHQALNPDKGPIEDITGDEKP